MRRTRGLRTGSERRQAGRGRHPRDAPHRDRGRGWRVPRIDLLALHDALERPAKQDTRKAEIVEEHIVGGLTYQETAAALGISPATVDRELRLAKAWLARELA